MSDSARVGIGEYAPWFSAPALGGIDNYQFDSVAGRHILLLFMASAGEPQTAAALGHLERNAALFDDDAAAFFGVTRDPDDAREGRIAPRIPGVRFLLDYGGSIAALYGTADAPCWLLLDPALRVIGRFAVTDAERALTALRACLSQPTVEDWAPVLRVPNVFEPELCARLIAYYEADGGADSGFMRTVDGKTVLVTDRFHKQRRDCLIDDDGLQRELKLRIQRRLRPAVQRALGFEATRIERWIVARYDAGAGHFRAHRDNTTAGTAHRQFAVTINLNAGDYDGGDLRFPEFGPRSYRAPTGGAIVFSCSLLHEATPVTRGSRYAFLPFLYDEAHAALRERNNESLGEGVARYRRETV